MKRIAYYISGHGYGHATRSIEVIRNILRQVPSAAAFVITDSPKWLFPRNIVESVRFIDGSCDIGAVQQNSFEVDVRATLKTVADFYGTFESRITEEADFLRNCRIDVVVGDIPALSFLAADAAGIASIGIANFSWDWIYQPYVAQYPEYSWIVDATQSAYSKAGKLLRLPFHGDLSVFPVIKDIPLIAGKPKKGREQTRQSLGIAPEERAILVLFRPADLDQIDTRRLAELAEYKFVFLNEISPAANFIITERDACTSPDLVAACDLVVTKPGYGIISECATTGTPMLYAARENFQEYDVLAKGLETLNMGALLPHDRLVSGDWGEAIQTILSENHTWEIPASNGAEVAAGEILGLP